MRVAFIGFGSIAKDTLAALEREGVDVEPTAILLRNSAAAAGRDLPFCDDLGTLLASGPDLVVECASQQAVAQYGGDVLGAGLPLLVVSIGALGNDALRKHLVDTASQNGSKLLLPAGAIGGIDALAAARIGGIDRVVYRARKPAAAWKGSAADGMIDLDALDRAVCFYSGDAREAARLFPKNSNVAATVALAGVGFDDTQVELVADPAATDNVHSLSVDGAAGSFEISLRGKPSASNPRTSMLTALSVARAIANRDAALVI